MLSKDKIIMIIDKIRTKIKITLSTNFYCIYYDIPILIICVVYL